MKVIKIDRCDFCPYRRYETINGKYINQCQKTFLEIFNGKVIPEWCPLDNE
jgi:hypothetical protein